MAQKFAVRLKDECADLLGPTESFFKTVTYEGNDTYRDELGNTWRKGAFRTMERV